MLLANRKRRALLLQEWCIVELESQLLEFGLSCLPGATCVAIEQVDGHWDCQDLVCLQVANGPAPVVHVVLVQERRIAELESQLEESQQQLEGAQSNRTVTQEALDQASSSPWCLSGAGYLV